MTVKEYLREVINFGGIPTPRYKIIEELKRLGATQREINIYMFTLDKRHYERRENSDTNGRLKKCNN